MLRLVVPFGFYGAGNIGDEATLNGFAQLLTRCSVPARVRVASRNPEHTARVEPAFRYFHSGGYDARRWFAKITASAHAMVGGTPIMDVLGEWPLSELTPLVRSIDRWKVPLSFVGVGTESLHFESSRRTVAEEISPRVRHWSVRCDRDRARLIEYGVSPSAITVAADMAWLIDPVPQDSGRDRLRTWGVDSRQPLIGVNLVNENQMFERNPVLAAELAAALDELADRMDARVIFLSNEVRTDASFDKQIAGQIAGLMKRADRVVVAPAIYLSPAQMMSVIGCCDLTISMRYHFCIFSALQGVPFIAIQRSDKVSDLCWDLGWSAAVSPTAFSATEIADHGMRSQNASALKIQLTQKVQAMKTRALRNTAALEALTSHVRGAEQNTPATSKL